MEISWTLILLKMSELFIVCEFVAFQLAEIHLIIK